MSTVVHGDDFNTLGLKADLDWYETELAKHFEINIRSQMGEGGDCTEIKILNGVLILSKEGLTYDADPCHVDLLTSSLGQVASNAVSTPGQKASEAELSATKHHEDEKIAADKMAEDKVYSTEDMGTMVCSITIKNQTTHPDLPSCLRSRSGLNTNALVQKHVRMNEEKNTCKNVRAYSEI